MAKTTTKKKKVSSESITITKPNTGEFDVVKEPEVEITEEELAPNENNCEYHLMMHFNGETHTTWTNNLQISILSFKPAMVHTEGYIKITKGTNFFERKLPLVNLRQLFNDPQMLEIMIANIYL